MSQFEINIEDLKRDDIHLDVQPDDETLETIFEAFNDDFQVDTDEDFHVDLYLTLDGRSVIVSGHVEGTFGYTCGRCLQERQTEVDSSVNLTMLSREEWEDAYVGEEEIALDAEDLDTTYYEDESVDLRPLIREAVVMALPAWPQCPDELRDSCDAAFEEHIGEETSEKLEKHSVDLRWWPLRDIEVDEDDGGESTSDQKDN